MANKDNKQNNENKQLTELSDEELKQVTGGEPVILYSCIKDSLPPCQQGFVERNHCCVPA